MQDDKMTQFDTELYDKLLKIGMVANADDYWKYTSEQWMILLQAKTYMKIRSIFILSILSFAGIAVLLLAL